MNNLTYQNCLDSFKGLENVFDGKKRPPIKSLAGNGLFHPLGRGIDTVQCVYCKGILKNWEQGDVAYDEHQRNFSECPKFITQRNIRTETINNQKFPDNAATFQGRLDSFNHKDYLFNHTENINSQSLAMNGFYYITGMEHIDGVKCVACNIGLGGWEVKDIIQEEHKQYSPNCPIVKNEVSGDSNFVKADTESPKSNRKNIGLEFNRCIAEHGSYLARLASYNGKNALFPNISTVALAQNGFYKMKGDTDDRVQCVACTGILKQWEPGDIIHNEHKRKFPSCPIVQDPKNCRGDSNFFAIT